MFKKIKKSLASLAVLMLLTSSLSANMPLTSTINTMPIDCSAFADGAATQWESEGGNYYEMWFFAYRYCLNNMMDWE